MKLAISDNRISSACERSLLKLGFRLLKLPPSQLLSAPLASHPDMLIFFGTDELITSCDYAERNDHIFSEISASLDGVRLTFTSDEPQEKYPKDCIFNALLMGSKLFVKSDSCSRAVLLYAERHGLTVIHTNQGYPACTVLPLGDKNALSADPGMARLLTENGINVTLIENGDIRLPPYDYGFIGGCAGVLGDTVYFLGNPEHHRDFERIASAISRAGMSYVSLSDEPLYDLGRIVL